METIPFGIIGCGYRGRELALLCAEHHLPLVWVADTDRGSAERLKADLKGRGLSVHAPEVAEALSSPVALAVIIATPTDTHLEVVEEVARAGKHILCEKPLAETVEDCRKIDSVCGRAKVRLAVGSQCRLWGVPAFVKQELLPRIGNIHAIMMRRLVPPPSIALSGWRSDARRNKGGQLLDHHVHNADILNWMFGTGEVLNAVSHQSGLTNWPFPDQYTAMLRYRPSSSSTAQCSFVASEVSRANEWSLMVDGEYGTLKVPVFTWRQEVATAHPPTIWFKGRTERHELRMPVENPNVVQLRRFLHAIAAQEPLDTTAADGTEAVRIIGDIIEKAVNV